MSVRINLTLPDDLHGWLKQEAKTVNIPLATYTVMSLAKQRQYEEMVKVSNQVWPILQKMTSEQIEELVKKTEKLD